MEDKFRPAEVTIEDIKELRPGYNEKSLFEAKEMAERSRRIQWLENLSKEMTPKPWNPNIEGVIRSLINYLQEQNKI